MAIEKKHSVKTFFTMLVWLCAVAGFLVLVVAAVRIRNKQACKGISVEITNAGDNFFVEKSDIRNLLLSDKSINPVGKNLDDINMQVLENKIKTNPWIRDAEIFIGNNNQLNIKVTQKSPVGRIFTRSGSSYYIDEEGEKIPLINKFTARVPVFTNFPSDTSAAAHVADSALFSQTVALSQFLIQDPFWMAMVDQVNINADRKFELIPKIGNQLIEFGDGTQIQEKFSKLLMFYQKAISTLGWERYDTIDIEYENEIVCSRNGKATSLTPIPPAAPASVQPDEEETIPGEQATAVNNQTEKGKPKALYSGEHSSKTKHN